MQTFKEFRKLQEKYKNDIVVYDTESGKPIKMFKSSEEKNAKKFINSKVSGKYGMSDAEEHKKTDPEFKDVINKMQSELEESLDEAVSKEKETLISKFGGKSLEGTKLYSLQFPSIEAYNKAKEFIGKNEKSLKPNNFNAIKRIIAFDNPLK